MHSSEVDFDRPEFTDHPVGWQTPNDLVDVFAVAWALELRARRMISQQYPLAESVFPRLPPEYRFDTLKHLLIPRPLPSGRELGRHAIARFTTICGAWRLFDDLNRSWRMEPQDVTKFGEMQSFVTGGNDRPSLYGGLNANFTKCLLAVRARRTFGGQEELDLAEEWFVDGDPELMFENERGENGILFHFSGFVTIPLELYDHVIVDSIWSTARVMVDRAGVDRVLDEQRHRVDAVSDLLVRGGRRAEQAKSELSPMQFNWANHWPGWH